MSLRCLHLRPYSGDDLIAALPASFTVFGVQGLNRPVTVIRAPSSGQGLTLDGLKLGHCL